MGKCFSKDSYDLPATATDPVKRTTQENRGAKTYSRLESAILKNASNSAAVALGNDKIHKNGLKTDEQTNATAVKTQESEVITVPPKLTEDIVPAEAVSKTGDHNGCVRISLRPEDLEEVDHQNKVDSAVSLLKQNNDDVNTAKTEEVTQVEVNKEVQKDAAPEYDEKDLTKRRVSFEFRKAFPVKLDDIDVITEDVKKENNDKDLTKRRVSLEFRKGIPVKFDDIEMITEDTQKGATPENDGKDLTKRRVSFEFRKAFPIKVDDIEIISEITEETEVNLKASDNVNTLLNIDEIKIDETAPNSQEEIDAVTKSFSKECESQIAIKENSKEKIENDKFISSLDRSIDAGSNLDNGEDVKTHPEFEITRRSIVQNPNADEVTVSKPVESATLNEASGVETMLINPTGDELKLEEDAVTKNLTETNPVLGSNSDKNTEELEAKTVGSVTKMLDTDGAETAEIVTRDGPADKKPQVEIIEIVSSESPALQEPDVASTTQGTVLQETHAGISEIVSFESTVLQERSVASTEMVTAEKQDIQEAHVANTEMVKTLQDSQGIENKKKYADETKSEKESVSDIVNSDSGTRSEDITVPQTLEDILESHQKVDNVDSGPKDTIDGGSNKTVNTATAATLHKNNTIEIESDKLQENNVQIQENANVNQETKQTDPNIIKQIQDVRNDVAELHQQLENFQGTNGDKEYAHFKEALGKNMLKLDSVEALESADIKNKRDDAISLIKECLRLLEQKCAKT